MVADADIETALLDCSMFEGLNEAERNRLVERATTVELERDAVVLEMGRSNSTVFVVVSGSLLVERPGLEVDAQLATMERGAAFGELSALDDERVSATIRAQTACRLLSIPAQTMREILENDAAIAAKVWRNMAFELKDRLIQSNRLVEHYLDLTEVLKENPDAIELLGY